MHATTTPSSSSLPPHSQDYNDAECAFVAPSFLSPYHNVLFPVRPLVPLSVLHISEGRALILRHLLDLANRSPIFTCLSSAERLPCQAIDRQTSRSASERRTECISLPKVAHLTLFAPPCAVHGQSSCVFHSFVSFTKVYKWRRAFCGSLKSICSTSSGLITTTLKFFRATASLTSSTGLPNFRCSSS